MYVKKEMLLSMSYDSEQRWDIYTSTDLAATVDMVLWY